MIPLRIAYGILLSCVIFFTDIWNFAGNKLVMDILA